MDFGIELDVVDQEVDEKSSVCLLIVMLREKNCNRRLLPPEYFTPSPRYKYPWLILPPD